MDRREYMREYKKRYRFKISGRRLPRGDCYLSLSCISEELADVEGGGRVNGWALATVDGVRCGDNVSSLFDTLACGNRFTPIYMLNLKVWGRFIVAEAMNRKYKQVDEVKNSGQYKILVNNEGAWLGIELNIEGRTAYLKDFNAIINTTIDDAVTAFLGCEMPTNATDAAIAASMQAVRIEFDDVLADIAGERLKAQTISSYAQKLLYSIYGDGCAAYGEYLFKQVYPEIDKDIIDDIRAANVYRGGLNYLDPQALKYTGAGVVLDRRSFYPYIYSNFSLPCGKPIKCNFEDIPETLKKLGANSDYYAIYNITELVADLLPDGVPSIQIINGAKQTQYLAEITFIGECKFMLDTYDLKTLYDNYNVSAISIDYCYIFKKEKDANLAKFGDKLFKIKELYKGTAKGVVAKYLINSITGRFGLNPYRRNVKIINGKYNWSKDIYTGSKGYLPVAMAINSIGRYLMASDIKKHREAYLYGDSDSALFKAEFPQEFLKNLKLKCGENMGEYDYKIFNTSKFLMRKCYGIELADGWRWIVAGASRDMLEKLKDNEFIPGKVLKGGCVPKIYDNMTIAFTTREFTLARQKAVF